MSPQNFMPTKHHYLLIKTSLVNRSVTFFKTAEIFPIKKLADKLGAKARLKKWLDEKNYGTLFTIRQFRGT